MGSTSSLPVFTAAVATYAVHSTMLLTVVWLIARMPVVKSHAIREQLWKWAAVAPLLTTCVQVCGTNSATVWEWQLDGAVAVSSSGNAPAQTDERTTSSGEVSNDTVAGAMKSEQPVNEAGPQDSEGVESDIPGDDVSVVPIQVVDTVEGDNQPRHRDASDDDWVIAIVPAVASAKEAALLRPRKPESKPTAIRRLLCAKTYKRLLSDGTSSDEQSDWFPECQNSRSKTHYIFS